MLDIQRIKLILAHQHDNLTVEERIWIDLLSKSKSKINKDLMHQEKDVYVALHNQLDLLEGVLIDACNKST
jgi:23S rRNA G2069 N7-methylase RlmK/C1962 C5-methylase RlmI